MAEPVKTFEGVVGSVALAAVAGALATVLLKLLIEISWPGAVFSGALIFALVAAFLVLVLARPLPTLAEIQAGQGASPKASVAPVAAPAAAVAAPAVAVEPAQAPAPAPAQAPAQAPEPAPVAAPTASAADLPPVAPDGKPEMLTAAREGGADDLKQIKGVGPKLEAMLNRMGVYHFDQIASWRAPEVAWVDENLEGFKGRVSRDNWVEQAKVLASGGETEFSKRVEDGGVY